MLNFFIAWCHIHSSSYPHLLGSKSRVSYRLEECYIMDLYTKLSFIPYQHQLFLKHGYIRLCNLALNSQAPAKSRSWTHVSPCLASLQFVCVWCLYLFICMWAHWCVGIPEGQKLRCWMSFGITSWPLLRQYLTDPGTHQLVWVSWPMSFRNLPVYAFPTGLGSHTHATAQLLYGFWRSELRPLCFPGRHFID